MDKVYSTNKEYRMPDNEIKNDHPSYVLVPLRGYAYTLAVFDCDDNCIGWIEVGNLGYDSVKEWMRHTNWRDQGY